MSVLKQRYHSVVSKKLMDKFGYANTMQLPRLTKIVLHMGIAEAAKDKTAIQDCETEMRQISGQKPVRTRAKKSISNFKLREGQIVGIKVTLRGSRMYDFAYRFINIACPRIKDFRGFPTKADGRGSYSLGFDDHQIFAELNLDAVKRAQGMHVTFVSTAQSDPECVELLRELGMPFKTP